MRRNCSSDQEKLLKFEAQGQEFTKILRSLEKFIQKVKGQNIFLVTECFFNLSWRFLISNELEQFKFKLEKKMGFRNIQEKFGNNFFNIIFQVYVKL